MKCNLVGIALLTSLPILNAQTTHPEFDSSAEAKAHAQTMRNLAIESKDSPIVILRSFSEDSFKQLAADKAFGYMQYADSFFRHRYDAAPKKLPIKDSAPAKQWPVFRIILWACAIGALLLLLWRFFFGKANPFGPGGLFTRQPTLTETTAALETNTNLLMREALDRADYRMAVRYRYLILLQQLSAGGMIQYTPDKTNRQYLDELSPATLRPLLASVMLQFEYNWYGGFAPDARQYATIDNLFRQIEKHLPHA